MPRLKELFLSVKELFLSVLTALLPRHRDHLTKIPILDMRSCVSRCWPGLFERYHKHTAYFFCHVLQPRSGS